MLLQLSIKNFAIFKDTIIDFNTGFSVITGESGAGKSVFITALSLINGERALKEYIRKGCEYSSVEAVYKVNKNYIVEVKAVPSDYKYRVQLVVSPGALIKLYPIYDTKAEAQAAADAFLASLI